MNNRDPFDLRKGQTGFSLLNQSASRAANTAFHYSRQTFEAGQQAFEAGKSRLQEATSKEDTMSFNIPRNVPSFQDPQRRFEDATWGSSGRSRFTEQSNAVADQISGIFGQKGNGLPMYKDKPYNYATSRRRTPWFRKRRLIAGLMLFLVGFLYWLGILTPGSTSNPLADIKGGKEKDSWSLFPSSSGSKGPVDWEERRKRVKDAFKISWLAYEDYAWGYDEFKPVSKKGMQMIKDGMGWIIVDSLDTLMLMNMTTELSHAREWISTSLSYDQDHDVNTFETTIRMLGGLLSAHYLSTEFPNMCPIPVVEGSPSEDLYLEKASDLADRLLGAYGSQSGVPYASVNLATRKGIPSHADSGASSTAEATSLQLEMKYLSKLTGEKLYWDKAEKVMQVVDDNGAKDGLVPIFIYATLGTFSSPNIRLGSRGDSYYEYLIKQYLQTSKEEPIYLDMWDEALEGVRKHLITYSWPSNFTVLGEREFGLDKSLTPKMDHLVCFMPGTIALAATEGKSLEEAKTRGSWGAKQEADMELAKELMKTCWGMYKVTPTGLAPEIAHFNLGDPVRMFSEGALSSPEPIDWYLEDADWHQDFIIKQLDKHNLQRPETVESLFYMWRITGDETYRNWGWEMFESFIKHTMTADGSAFTSIGDVTQIPPPLRDNMESFWMAETLKYFYLLFGPNDILPLDQVVLNTEAHPFPRFELGKLFSTGWKRKPRDKDGKIINVPQKKDETEAESGSGVKVFIG